MNTSDNAPENRGVAREFLAFLTSGVFLKNCLGMVGLVAVILLLTVWWMQCYTRHGESRQVKDFSGMTVQQAISQADDEGLRAVVIDSSRFDPNIDPGVVIDQDPKALSRVKTNRTIYLTINRRNPPEVTLPTDLWGKDIGDVERRLRALQISAEVVGRSYDGPPNTVIDIVYQTDTLTDALRNDQTVKIPKYATLKFIIGESEAAFVTLEESLVCKTYNEAKFLIGANALTIGSVIVQEELPDSTTSYVWRTDPVLGSGTQLRRGEQVTLFLQRDLPEGCTPDPIDLEFEEEQDDSGGNPWDFE